MGHLHYVTLCLLNLTTCVIYFLFFFGSNLPLDICLVRRWFNLSHLLLGLFDQNYIYVCLPFQPHPIQKHNSFLKNKNGSLFKSVINDSE